MRLMQLADNRPRRRVISLTPLIDVVFILLLFFMLSTQFTQQRALEIVVRAGNSAVLPEEDETLVLHLSDTGSIMIADGEPMPVASLVTHPAVQNAIARDAPILLDADDEVALQLLVSVTDLLERNGAGSVQLRALRKP